MKEIIDVLKMESEGEKRRSQRSEIESKRRGENWACLFTYQVHTLYCGGAFGP